LPDGAADRGLGGETGKSGAGVPDAKASPPRDDGRRDGEALFDVLSKEVIPLFYERDSDGLPRTWSKMMMNSISSLAWRFSAHRMVMDYARACYVPAAGGVSCDMHTR
jgi:starch phosphorylase